MFPPSSPFAGLYKIFFVILAIGALAAFALSNSDLANPITRSAEAWERLRANQVVADAQIATQNEMDAIDVKVKDAEAKAQIAKLEIEKESYPELYKQQLQVQAQQTALEMEKSRQQAILDFERAQQQDRLEFERSSQQAALEFERSRVVQYGMIGLGMILAICFSVVMIQFGRRRLVVAQTQTQAKQTDGWQDSTWRKNQIELARQRELKIRASDVRRAQTTVVPAFYADQDAPISWEEIRQQFAEARKNQKNS